MSIHVSAESRRKLHLVRHGQTEWNVQGRWQGHMGGPLTAVGLEQADKVAKGLLQYPIEVVYCSDLERAVMTAQRISQVCNAPIVKDERLREICLGDWEGELGEELKRKHPSQFEERQKSPLTFRAPNGENILDVRKRLQCWLMDVHLSPYSNIVVVSHAVTLSVLRAELCGEPLESSYHSHLGNGDAHLCAMPSIYVVKNSGELV